MLIRRASVLDGTGADAETADVRLDGPDVVAISPAITPSPGEVVLDADGLTLAPGFVDLHSHSDLWSVVPGADGAPIGDVPKLLQGCTFQVFGQDGISAAPIAPDDDDFRGFQAGLNGRLPEEHWTWQSFADYLGALRRTCSTRATSLVGHATVRRYVMGMARREPTSAEIAAMQDTLREAFAAGACGFSTGLVYVPAAYATTEEVHALAEVVAEHDLPFFVHVRSESEQVIEASEEVIGVSASTGCHLHYSHIKCAGRTNWGKAGHLLDLIEAAHADGVRIGADIHPYTAGSTAATILLPPWAHEGGREAMLRRLHDPTVRSRLRTEMLEDTTSWDNWWVFSDGWDGLKVAQAERPGVVGRYLREVLTDAGHDDLHGREAFDTFFDLMIDERLEMTIVSFNNVEENVVRFFSQPWCSVGTDGVVRARRPSSPSALRDVPRVLGRFVREMGATDLADAVRKCTSQAAAVVRADSAGRIRVGAPADLVLFDAERIIDRATYEEPRLPPIGVEAVWVAGRQVVDGGGLVPGAATPVG